MDTIIDQPIEMKQRYPKLPESIKELFRYGTVDSVLETVVAEYGLNEQQSAALNMEIELVLYMFTPLTDLKNNIQASLEIDEQRASEITSRLTEDLFIIVKQEVELANKLFAGEVAAADLTDPNVLAAALQTKTTETAKEAPETTAIPTDGLKQVRTFADDVEANRAHGYGTKNTIQETDSEEPTHRSNQDDIIK